MKKYTIQFIILISLQSIVSSCIVALPKAPNQGNYNASSSCFLNAANQAFFHLKPFRRFLETAKKENYYNPKTTAEKFIKYIDLMAENKKPISPKKFRKNVTENAISNSIYKMRVGQHDSQEYFSYILQILREQINNRSIEIASQKLESLFALTLQQTIQAPNMTQQEDRLTIKDEQYWTLSLYPNNQNNTLAHLIENRFRDEKIDKKDETINKWHTATKSLSIKQLPEILVLHIMRFTSGEVSLIEKDTSSISFPLQNLDLKPYLTDALKFEESRYDLVAIIEHGGGLTGGHYWTYAQSENNWYKYDDMSLKPAHYVSEKEIQEIAQQKIEKGCPYLLMYVRKKLQKPFTLSNKEEDASDEVSNKKTSGSDDESYEEEKEKEYNTLKTKKITSQYLKEVLGKIPATPNKNLKSQCNEIQKEQQWLEKMLETALSRLNKLEKETHKPEKPKEIRSSLETVQKLLQILKQKLATLIKEIMKLKQK